jgi:hypothetical protein
MQLLSSINRVAYVWLVWKGRMSQRASQQFHRKQRIEKEKTCLPKRALRRTKGKIARISIFSHRGIYIQGET